MCIFLMCVMVLAFPQANDAENESFDVVIYGGTASGIAAAVQVVRNNKSVVVIEPTRRIGGLTTGGLGQTDIGNKAAIGGISREFYQAVKAYYEDSRNWKFQKRDEYSSIGQSRTRAGEDAMWTFEPSAALRIFESWVRRDQIKVVYQERIDREVVNSESTRTKGVLIKNRRIRGVVMESGRVFYGKAFIDASYEGDLLAAAGIEYTVGRESVEKYGESLNGVQVGKAIHHQMRPQIDPYVEAGNPESGLLPGIDISGPGVEGSADRRIQAYNFRMCLTNFPENRIPFKKPEDYDSLDHELLLRNLEAGEKRFPWSNGNMPNWKTDTNNNRGVSTDFIGQNYKYPEASYAEREKIVSRHRSYQQGLMWTLAYHPRVPQEMRDEFSQWGTCKDEFDRTDGWPNQIYVREARRMIGSYVMTQHDCQGRRVADDPIGLAAYTMDSHNTQRYVDSNGWVRNEGDVQVGGFEPYGISYRAIVPQANQCTNLLVPVCLSASHISFGSIRMEPVFMVLGQSAAMAACMAIESNCGVQQVDYTQLRRQLLSAGQILKWKRKQSGSVVKGVQPKNLTGVVVDESVRVGFNVESTSAAPYVGKSYLHDNNDAKGQQSAVFSIPINNPGKYEVRISYTAHANRASNVPITIIDDHLATKLKLDQRLPPGDGPFKSLGVFDYFKVNPAIVVVSNAGTDGIVVVDAVQLIETTKK